MININNVILVGRLTKDIELRKTESNLSVCSFTLAVNRKTKNDKGEYDADFINCVAWRQSADFLDTYASKGDLVAVIGSIATRSYDGKNGKVYITEVIADNVQLIKKEEKPQEEPQRTVIKSEPKYDYSTMNKGEAVEEIKIEQLDLPFY